MVFDDEGLVADAGLLVAGTLMDRLGLEGLVDRTVRLEGRVGGANPGRKVLTLVSAILAGGGVAPLLWTVFGLGVSRVVGSVGCSFRSRRVSGIRWSNAAGVGCRSLRSVVEDF